MKINEDELDNYMDDFTCIVEDIVDTMIDAPYNFRRMEDRGNEVANVFSYVMNDVVYHLCFRNLARFAMSEAVVDLNDSALNAPNTGVEGRTCYEHLHNPTAGVKSALWSGEAIEAKWGELDLDALLDEEALED